MSSTPTALMYAELLSNIRQVSVIASLPTPSTPDTRATLSDDRLQLRLVHNGATVLLILPAQVAAVPSLQQPKLGNREISWRLGLPNTTSTYHGADSAGNPSAPWSASTLSEQSLISCRKCRNSLLATEGSVKSWKDLPSENWAEMMDFWHCHKPSIHKKHTADGHHVTHLDEKGYGANTRFMARRGVGFVDLTYLLLSKEDCPGVKVWIRYFLSSSCLKSAHGYQEGGSASVCPQWPGHRYKYPILIPCSILLRQHHLMSTLFSDYGLLDLDGGSPPRHFLRIFLRYWKAMGLTRGTFLFYPHRYLR